MDIVNGIDNHIKLIKYSLTSLLRNDDLSGSLVLTLQFYRILLHVRLDSHTAIRHDVAWHWHGAILAENANLFDNRILLEDLLRYCMVGILSFLLTAKISLSTLSAIQVSLNADVVT